MNKGRYVIKSGYTTFLFGCLCISPHLFRVNPCMYRIHTLMYVCARGCVDPLPMHYYLCISSTHVQVCFRITSAEKESVVLHMLAFLSCFVYGCIYIYIYIYIIPKYGRLTAYLMHSSGTYSSSPGSGTCLKCENFSVPSAGSSTCECAPGYYGAPNFPNQDSAGGLAVFNPPQVCTYKACNDVWLCICICNGYSALNFLGQDPVLPVLNPPACMCERVVFL
jgi:hypothetical protein